MSFPHPPLLPPSYFRVGRGGGGGGGSSSSLPPAMEEEEDVIDMALD